MVIHCKLYSMLVALHKNNQFKNRIIKQKVTVYYCFTIHFVKHNGFQILPIFEIPSLNFFSTYFNVFTFSFIKVININQLFMVFYIF